MSLRGRVTATDVAIGAAFVAASEFEVWREDITPTALAAASFLVLGLAVTIRRVAPLAALVIGLGSQLVAVVGGVSLQTPVTPLLFFVFVLYNVGLREERPVLGLGVGAVLTTAVLFIANQNGEFEASDIPFVTLVVCTPWFVGYAMRAKVRRSEELELRAERVERERVTAVAEERTRIARELHDVIAHSVSVMVVQAGAAEEVLKRSPEAALEPIRAVQETGRQALVEMSRLVGLRARGARGLGHPGRPPCEPLARGRPASPAARRRAHRLPRRAGGAHERAEARRRRRRPGARPLRARRPPAGGRRRRAGGERLRRGTWSRGDAGAGQRVRRRRQRRQPTGGFAVRVRLPIEEAT